jgi:hypothetical protein
MVIAFALTIVSSPLFAQWPAYPTAGVPKTADGKPKFDAPAPRTSDGKPDLSGVWEVVPCSGCAPAPGQSATLAGVLPAANAPIPPAALDPSGFVFANVGAGMPDRKAPYQQWAAELVAKRKADNSKDNPDAHCLPMGIMQLTTHPYPRKIIQTPSEIVIIYEGSGTTVREIFLDGRPLPKDPEPWWNGYSIGHWEGDTLVVETSGLMDDGWLDVVGSPLTSAGKLTERFRRLNYGSLDLTVTIDDPKAYTKPFNADVHYHVMLDTQLIEFVCIDKDAAHYVGAPAK